MEYMEIKNPITGDINGQIPLQTAVDLKECLKKARNAQKNWAGLSVKQRSQKIHLVIDYLYRNAESIAEIISRNNGKPRIDALSTEVLPVMIATRFYCKNAYKFLRDKRIRRSSIFFINKKSLFRRVPYGVIGIISPWNYPFSIPFYQVIQGLLSGNAIILKTASETQGVGLALKTAIESIQLPQGIFQYINLPGREAGKAFLENGIDKLFFTGSVQVGKYLMAKAAENLTPLNLELGGNDPMLICEDADLIRAANGAIWGGLSNAGQSCGGVERIYAHANIYHDFLEILKAKVENLNVRYDDDFKSDMSGMTTKSQVETVQSQIKDALKKGAKIFACSKIPDDPRYKNFLPACVIIDVHHNMEIMREETFGPVVCVMKVDTMEDALKLANDSHLGLTGSVWSRNIKKAELLGRQIQAGVITINDHLMSHGMPETSWGGFKQSGIGYSHGRQGFEEMTRPQYIIKDILPGVKRNLWWHPYNKDVYKTIKSATDFLFSGEITKKIKGAIHLMIAIPKMFTDNLKLKKSGRE